MSYARETVVWRCNCVSELRLKSGRIGANCANRKSKEAGEASAVCVDCEGVKVSSFPCACRLY